MASKPRVSMWPSGSLPGVTPRKSETETQPHRSVGACVHKSGLKSQGSTAQMGHCRLRCRAGLAWCPWRAGALGDGDRRCARVSLFLGAVWTCSTTGQKAGSASGAHSSRLRASFWGRAALTLVVVIVNPCKALLGWAF